MLRLTENENIAIQHLKEVLLKKFNLIDFRLYGSKVRAESNAESDIDVMIELDELNYSIESQIDDIIFEINMEYDIFISILFFSKSEIERGPMSESPIYKTIQKQGVPF